ncbi:MAG: SDR family oxidoreductase [Desulfobacteraceae bacterium]|nr:SDR family oxidoreductase [Desulfobacteraceae bacterium]
MMGLFDGKVAIVTGAGRGVGRSEAMLLAAEGAKVVVNDLGGGVDGAGNDAKVADLVVQEIKNAGGQAAANYDDISTVEGADSLVWTAQSKFGRLDILINNAGILRDKTLLNMTENDWDLVMKVHAKGTFVCTRAAARFMRTQGQGGAIINTTSISGLAGNFGQANYGAAKLAIYGLTKICAMEFARNNIRVNCVSPSGFTRMVASIPGAGSQLPDGVKMEDVNSVEPTARLAIFFASDLSKQLTGRVMGSNGGIYGNKVCEYKMMISEGYEKKDGMLTLEDLAANIDKVLFKEPDITMAAGRSAPRT